MERNTQLQKFNGFNGRKIVKSSTRQGLINKMKDSETRNWRAVSEIQQYNFCGQWVCVMELQNHKGVDVLNG
ncbi:MULTISPECIES: hypothetical protein [Lysinibacillus]|uniref:hypothetical protein n=1 Tax=Lysinibacillus TaxID=400634 RepID=UPI002899D460|nr:MULTISPECIES: hypothetical protein [Lysinibacillus]MED3799973.1 hypothetical protein [Lysinibacillus capsici]